MILDNFIKEKIGLDQVFYFTVTSNSGEISTIWFSSNTIDLYPSIKTAILLVLLIAMKKNENIIIPGKFIESTFLDNIFKLQSIFKEWFPELNLSKIDIQCEIFDLPERNSNKETQYLSYFTAGVDSFNTLIEEKSRIEKLIFILGFDIHYNDTILQENVIHRIGNIASSHQKDLILVKTNLRDYTEKYVRWEYIHGLALGAIGHMFYFRCKIFIPSSVDDTHNTKYGSHKSFDTLLSHGEIQYQHSGEEKSRIEKVKNTISQSNIALKNLRVCWRNIHSTYNCCICEKCIRSKIELDIANALERAETFQNKEISKYLAEITISNEITANFYREMIPLLEEKMVGYSSIIKNKLSQFTMTPLDTISTLNTFTQKKKNILFVDFNGVLSYNPFWITLKNPDHKLHKYFSDIEEYIFRGDKETVLTWMTGKLTTEEIHKKLQERYKITDHEILEIESLFIEECKHIDLEETILATLKELKLYYHLVLVTDNMDTFSRFTLPNNPILNDIFDEIHDSYIKKHLKKNNNGELFLKITQNHGVLLEYSTLVDDSTNNCKCFLELGGKVFTPKSKEESIKTFQDILINTKNKWEWQY